ncbi:MAG: hypothetical protein ABI540_09305 [Spartobacteria bacterium]
MNDQFEGDWLERRLRDEMPYINDDGFTARVLQQLPATQSRYSVRAAVLLCLTLLASIITYFVSDGGRFLIEAVYRLASLPLLFVGLLAICSTLLVTALAANAALSTARTER